MLPRASRLSSERDFRFVYSRSRTISTSRIMLAFRRRRLAGPGRQFLEDVRIGFSVGRKAARKAHERNLIKRRLREIARIDILPELRGLGIDIVVSAKSDAATAAYGELREDMIKLFSQMRTMTPVQRSA